MSRPVDVADDHELIIIRSCSVRDRLPVTRRSSSSEEAPITQVSHRSIRPRALARSCSVGRASTSSRECVT
ncbi:hypothetical protein [Streptomyces globosus]|uniref:hypothetical protein n=1 Tax=Streptomyces globosus TaxID=68209 RepID=UPI0036268C5E